MIAIFFSSVCNLDIGISDSHGVAVAKGKNHRSSLSLELCFCISLH